MSSSGNSNDMNSKKAHWYKCECSDCICGNARVGWGGGWRGPGGRHRATVARLQWKPAFSLSWLFLPPSSRLQNHIVEPRIMEMVKVRVNLSWKAKITRIVALGKDAVRTESRETNTTKTTPWPHSRGVSGPLIWRLFPCSIFIPSSSSLGSQESRIPPLSPPEKLCSSHRDLRNVLNVDRSLLERWVQPSSSSSICPFF